MTKNSNIESTECKFQPLQGASLANTVTSLTAWNFQETKNNTSTVTGETTGNFTGTGIAFLEAPVNFPDTYRVR